MKKGFIIAIIIIAIIILCSVGFIARKNNVSEEKNYTIEQIEDYSYFVLKKDDSYGVIDKDGQIIIEPTYSEVVIPNPEKDVFICYENGKTIILNSNSEQIFSEYEQVEPIRLKNVNSDLMYEKSTLTYVKDNKIGIMNLSGEKITENKYENVEALSSQEGKLLVKQNGKVGVININGYKLIDCDYDTIDIDGYYQEEDGYKYAGYIVSITTEEGYRYGYINYEGKKIVDVECNELSRVMDIEDKNHSYLILAKNGQYGLYDNQDIILENEYQSIQYDKENQVFIVEKSKQYGLTDIKGNQILPIEYDQIDITGICIYARKDQLTKVIDKTGKELDIDEYTSITNTDNEKYKIIITSTDSNISYGVMNQNDEELIPQQYTYIKYLTNKYFSVSDKAGNLGIVDENNNQMLDLQYSSILKIEGTNIIQAGKPDGTIEFYSSEIEKICEVKDAVVELKDKYLYIKNDEEMKYIDIDTEKETTNIEVYKDNSLFANKENGKWGFIDANGNTVVETQFDKVTEFNEYGYAGIKKDGKWGIINSNGEIVLEPTYVLQDEKYLNFIGEYYGVEYGYGEIYYTNQIEQNNEKESE